MVATHYKWTLDRYHRAIDAGLFDDQAVELLKGDIVVMALEREPHDCFSSDGAEYLWNVLGDRASIREGKPVTLPNQSEPVPDLAIVKPPLRRYLAHHPYPEDIFWLIEFSNSTLDFIGNKGLCPGNCFLARRSRAKKQFPIKSIRQRFR